MRADEPIETALRVLGEEHARKLNKRLKKASKGDPDGVHDARTALRRARVDLELMGRTVFDAAAAARLESELHDLERSLAKARDSDVVLADLDAYLRAHRELRDGLAPLAKRLKRRRTKGARAAHVVLDGARRSAVRALRRFLESRACVVVEPTPGSPRALPTLVRHFTHDEIWHRYEALRAFDARVLRDPEELHKLRAACRSLRYALEVFADTLPESSRIVKELRAMQDQIGTMHDHHVAATLVERWMRTGKLRATSELEAYVEDQKRERDRLRDKLGDRWMRVLGAGFRAELARALEEEKAGARAVN